MNCEVCNMAKIAFRMCEYKKMLKRKDISYYYPGLRPPLLK